MSVTETFDATSTWTCPEGVTSAFIECRGGAGGAGETTSAEGGGGGGAYANKTLTVVPSTVYDVIVGEAGALESIGGDSWFGDGLDVSAAGGGGALNLTGGTGGLAASSIGDVTTSGGSGGNGSSGGGPRAGGGGGAAGSASGNGADGTSGSGDSPGVGGVGAGGAGSGGNGGASGQNGQNGNAPGGAAGGGGNGGGAAGVSANGRVTITYDLPVTGGYEVYLTEGRTADPGVDTPVDVLPKTEAQLAISTAGLNANSLYRVTVFAFNATGRSTPAFADFKTDGTGGAVFIPSIVTNLRVTPLAGGQARATWEYDEQVADHFADTFSISVTPLEGQAPVVVADVPFASIVRSYATTFGGADGLYIVKVFSKRAGAYQAAVSGVYVRLDGTPPTTGIDGLEAE